ncbi:ABC transporter permease [Microbulbifer thermotolerans]|uniref:ABC transporter permease n=1 Tax=Microbulbifer thermotolerans TaxID=252514 RepID=UPI00267343C9|nr:ABC transporter permease [Microbulbifer thermotolerans]WKT61327.1 ABC transporter permease [Microbulbifer thermotolerans]
MNWRRLWAVVIKELRQLRRDHITLLMIVGMPILQLVLFGYAINLNPRHLPAAIADQALTSGSRQVVMDMLATGVIEPVKDAESPQQLMSMLRRGEISVGVVIPWDFERRRALGESSVQVLVDGSDTVVQNAALQLAQMPLTYTPGSPRDSSIPLPELPISVVAFYNPQRVSAITIVPGLIGIILTMTMMMFTAVAIVRERERGNMELLIATPVSKGELMLGKLLPYGAIGLIQTSLILLSGVLLFQVPIRGSLLDVYLSALLLIFANLSLGLLISTATQSQFQAIQMTFFVFVPSILLSGFVFPFEGMPEPAQWIAELLPLTHFIRLIRGIMLRGAELVELWRGWLALLVFLALMMTLAVARFHKRLD